MPTSTPLTIDRYLSSPILDYPLEVWKEEYSCVSGTFQPGKYGDMRNDKSVRATRQYCKDVIKVLTKSGRMELASPPIIQPRDYQDYMNITPVENDKVRLAMTRAELAVQPIIASHVRALDKLSGLIKSSQFPSPYSFKILQLSYLLENFDAPVRRLYNNCISGKPRLIIMKTHDLWVVITPEICYIEKILDKKIGHLCTYNQFLMMKDCVLTRRNALMASQIMFTESSTLPGLIQASWSWQDLCIKIHNNNGFPIAKGTEAMAKTYLSRMAGDPLSGDGDSYSDMVRKFNQKDIDTAAKSGPQGYTPGRLANVYEKTVLNKIPNIQECVELFGVQKLCCHPTINLKESGKGLRETAQKRCDVLQSDSELLRNIIRRGFIINFVHKEKRWPKIEFLEHGSLLEQAYNMQVINIHAKSFPLLEYGLFKFKQEFNFNYHSEYTDLLDDKAVARREDEKHLAWDDGNQTTQSRLLLEILSRPSFSPEQIVKLVEDDKVPNWMYTEAMVPKELEFKPEGRQFGLCTPDMRTFFVVEEANIAEHFLKYFPGITMTDGKMSIHKRLLGMTDPSQSDNVVKMLGEFDLEKWNAKWRKETCDPTGQDFNDLTGMKRVFTFIHSYFERNTMYIKTPGARPPGIELQNPPESDLCWKKHLAGMEGRVQKFWSILTWGMYGIGAEDLDIPYTIAIQGDNIITSHELVIDWSMNYVDFLKENKVKILSATSQGVARVGHISKFEECVISTEVETYSKVVYVKSVDFPTTIKSLMKTKPASASDFPSFSADIRSIFAGSYAAAEVSRKPERCYWYALYQSALYILMEATGNGAFSKMIEITGIASYPERLRFALILPSELGGFPIIGPYNFLYRGGGDPLSKSIAGLKMLQESLPQSRQCISVLEDPLTYTKIPKFENLVLDPFGLPISKPRNADDSVADETLESLISFTRNKDFTDLFNFATDNYKDSLLASLSTLKPFNSLVARDLYDCSVFGTVDTVKRMFLKTRTVQTLVRSEEGTNITDIILSAAKKEISFVHTQYLRSRGKQNKILFVYTSVERARSMWLPCGVIPEGITAYLPLDFNLSIDPGPDALGIRLEVQPSGVDLMYTKGRIPPYFGSDTEQVMSNHGFKIVGQGSAVSALKSLQSIYSWSEREGGIKTIIDYLSRSRAGVNLSSFADKIAERLGGDLGHRFDSRLGERGAYILGYTTFASHCVLNSDRAGFLSATVDDMKVMVQSFMCFLISLAGYRWDHYRDESHFTMVVDVGTEILDILDTALLQANVPSPLHEVPRGLVLAQTDVVILQRETGYLENETFNAPYLDNPIIPTVAIISEIYQNISRRTFANAAISHQKDDRLRTLGVQEIRGLGIRKFLDLACIAIFDCLTKEIPSPGDTRFRDSSLSSLIIDYSDYVINTVLQYWNHPIIQEDEFVIEMELFDGPSYNSRGTIRRVLRSVLATRMEYITSDPNSLLFTLPIVMFSSETSSKTPMLYHRLLRRILTRECLRGNISYSDASFLVGSSISRSRALSAGRETDEMTTLGQVLTTFGYHRKGKELVSDDARRVAERIAASADGYQVFRCITASNEAIREFRYVQPPSRIKENNRIFTSPDLSVISPETIVSVPDHITLTELRNDLSMMYRKTGMSHSFGVHSTRIWLPLSSLFKGKDVLIIGSGEGATAAAAGVAGAKSIKGHDLRKDYPYGTIHSEYCPPLVRFYCRGANFSQTDATLSTTGNWFDNGVPERLLRTNGGVNLLVIDISNEDGRSFKVLKPLVLSGYKGKCLLRIRNVPDQHKNVVGCIVKHGKLLGCWQSDDTLKIIDRVYLFNVKKSNWDVNWDLMDVINPQGLQNFPFKSTLKRIVQDLLSPIGCSIQGRVATILNTAWDLGCDMLSRNVVKISYHDMTQLLVAMVSIELLLLGSINSYHFRVAQILHNGVIWLNTSPKRQVIFSNDLKYAITRVAPCVLGHLDKIVN